MQKGIIKNVNKLTGEPIDAKDLASMLSGIIGNESGVLTVFDELRLEKISDNKVRLHSGVYSLKGHILYIPKGSYEDFEIESGTLGANRIDLLVAEFVKNGEGGGEDTLQFKIVKGETSSGSPQKPEIVQHDINSNGITRQEILYELRLTGINLSIKNKLSNIKDIGTLQKYTDETINSLIDSGFNENGRWIKFFDGTLICFGVVELNSTFWSVRERDSLRGDWFFPYPFLFTPFVEGTVRWQMLSNPDIRPYDYSQITFHTGFSSKEKARLQVISEDKQFSNSHILEADVVAIGRWK